jgi:SAM-dependent methyltransferase
MTMGQPSTGLEANALDTFGPGFMEISDRLGRYDTTEQDARQAIALLGLQPGARVLDAACGFGRFAGALHELGCAAVGVDISPAAIAEARRRCPGPQYVVGDLREPLPQLGAFDALVNVFSSFGYGASVEEDQQMLDNWHRLLRPGAQLLMELSDLERSRARLGGLGRTVTRETNGVTEILRVDPATHVLHIRYELGEHELEVETRLFEADELVEMVERAGFHDVRSYGGFDGHPKTPEDRLVLVAVA